MAQRHTDVCRQSLLLSNCPDEIAEAVLARAHVHHVPRGATLFEQGDRAQSVYIVVDGWVKLYRMTVAGAEAVVGVFTRGRSFGEAAAFRNDVYPVSAEAVTDCELVQVPAAHLLDLMRSRPEVCVGILSATFAHLHALVEQVEQLKAQTGAQRVAQFLLSLAPCESGACTVVLPYDKVLIAGRIGIKPESLSRAFARLKPYGVSIRQNHAAIADMGRLADFAEGDSPQIRATAQ